MKGLLKNIVIIFLVFLLISSVYTLFNNNSFSEEKRIGLSELVNEINDGRVGQIVVKGDTLSVELKDGTKQKIKKEPESSLTQTFVNYGVSSDKIKEINISVQENSGFGFVLLNILPILLPFLILGGFIWFLMRQAQRGNTQALSFGRSKAKILNPDKDKKDRITFKDVAGLKEPKEELREVVDFLKTPKKYIGIGAKIPKGVLLVGPPGTGKTLLARAVANEANVPFFHTSGSEFVEMFVGVGAARIRDTFKNAKKSAPAILFVDELDAVGRHRGAGLGGGHDEREQTLNQILVEMDGFEPNSSIVVMAATNRPDVLDPALLRPGRFDRRVILDLPDINDREEILKIHARNKPFEQNTDLRQIAQRTPGFSGADLANLVNEAAILAARKNKKTISQDDLRESIEKVLLGPERKSHILSPKEKEIAAYHEAGHALVAASLPNADPIHKVSIVSRGSAAGYTLKLPSEDRHLHTRSEFLDDLSVFLGGYAAEKLIFKEITTGASSDIQQASDLARRLITQYGMSDTLGPIRWADKEEMVFLGKELTTGRHYSEKVAAKIDEEVAKLIDGALKTAQKILIKKNNKLKEIAGRLIEKETIEKQEFEEMVKA